MLSRVLTVSALALAVSTASVVIDQAAPVTGLVSAAAAQDDKKPQRETRRTPALRNKVYEKLAEAQTFAEEKNYTAAGKVLDGMIAGEGKKALNSYELANVYNLYAFLRYSAEDYAGAVRYYEQVIAQPDIPLAMEINTKFTIAQLYFVQEDWNKGINTLLAWFELTDEPNANAYVLLAQGYYQKKDYDEALVNVETAISMYEAKGKLPKEQWYNLARFLYFDKNDIDNALATLELLLMYYPKKSYWVQASHLYGEKKQEGNQLAMLEAAHEQGLLDKSSDLVTLAYLYLNAEVPYPAAKVMTAGFEADVIEDKSTNYELAGTAWRQAQERKKSIPYMEKAASKSDEGELFVRLGNLYLDGDQFKQAVTALEKGLKKGGVKRPDQARLALGMAHFNLGNYSSARKVFRVAAKDDRSESYARQWLKYIQSEEDRQKQLAKEI
ncbi:tetratricopeptide TPR_2 [Luminiphilus syltensis NOR5-1B]|uniref:Tetratricopeptide TPR_2 n=1 Tax=Luminiphilus syltensis NOR5-1B TaxID=565045 RepID=B8KTP7_9GAMM|nr:tetratricopeptide repeat protein [Luminiphilus syltensis]EED34177.1 tetratricopeptide TPR_2 [Luminiphilus syltensis NOR5-1B]